MSYDKEIGVFSTGLAITTEGLIRYEQTLGYLLSPILYELMHKCEDCITEEGIYKFTLTVAKMK
jgi:hypothetical protein